MKLSINTSKKDKILISLNEGDKIVDYLEIEAEYRQSEKLLPNIEKLLEKNNIMLNNIEYVEVKPTGESFSALRIGVVTANALAYALGIEAKSTENKQNISKNGLKLVNPRYSQEPNITNPQICTNNTNQ